MADYDGHATPSPRPGPVPEAFWMRKPISRTEAKVQRAAGLAGRATRFWAGSCHEMEARPGQASRAGSGSAEIEIRGLFGLVWDRIATREFDARGLAQAEPTRGFSSMTFFLPFIKCHRTFGVPAKYVCIPGHECCSHFVRSVRNARKSTRSPVPGTSYCFYKTFL